MATLTLPLFPLSTVLFPDGVLPLQIFEVRYLDMISHCLTEDTPFGVVLLTHGQEVRTPTGAERFVGSGTLASVQDTTASTPGLLQVVCRGGARFICDLLRGRAEAPSRVPAARLRCCRRVEHL